VVTAPEIRVLDDLTELAREAADLFLWMAEQAIGRAGRFRVCLSGGSTPRRLYEALAVSRGKPGMTPLDWKAVEFYFGDERCVPSDDPASNFGMVRATLFQALQIRDGQIFRMRGEADPEQAAQEYERLLRDRFGPAGWPRFDLLLLGLGEDAHVASLFPVSAALYECRRAVVPTVAPREPQRRISLTIPVLNEAEAVLFLVSGPAKAQAVRRALERTGPADPEVPASYVQPLHGRLLWLLDRAAAAELTLARQSIVSHEE
jgi:6-phosphogluconolactonase